MATTAASPGFIDTNVLVYATIGLAVSLGRNRRPASNRNGSSARVDDDHESWPLRASVSTARVKSGHDAVLFLAPCWSQDYREITRPVNGTADPSPGCRPDRRGRGLWQN